ncbi:MAG: MFS transporter [Candidatus Bathyarchaeota archaeon]|nr:MFS transporter [Candidatus Bathyarchaeota archaeon]
MSRLLGRWEYNYTVLLITWMGWISIYLARSVLPPVLPVLSTELGLTHAQAGLLETAYLIGYIISKLPAGDLSNRYGARRVLAASMVGYGASTLLITGARGFLDIFVLRFLVGLFQGVHLPVSNALLSDRFRGKQARAIGFNESGPNIGNTLAFPITVTIMEALGWRYAFLFLSIPAFLLSLGTMILMKEEPERETEPRQGPKPSLGYYKRILIPFALSHAAYNLILRTTFTFTPSFLVEFRGMNIALAGLISTVLPFAGIFTKMGSGFIMERVGSKQAILVASSLSAVLLSALVIFPGGWLTLNLLALGLTLYSFSPIIYAGTTSSLPRELKALGLGVVTIFGNIVGAVSTTAVGLAIDSRGYVFTFIAIAGVTLVSAFIIQISMKEDGRDIVL